MFCWVDWRFSQLPRSHWSWRKCQIGNYGQQTSIVDLHHGFIRVNIRNYRQITHFGYEKKWSERNLIFLLFSAQIVQTNLGASVNLVICKLIISLPFIFCNTILVLWSLISFYRLHLVRKAGDINLLQNLNMSLSFQKISANRRTAKTRRRFSSRTSEISQKIIQNSDCTPSIVLPSLGVILGLLVGISMTIFSDSFVLLRDCRGDCIDPLIEFDEWKAALVMVASTCIFHVPSSLCYLFIYCIVKKHQRAQVRFFFDLCLKKY